MERVDLDKEYDLWLDRVGDDLVKDFLDSVNDELQTYIEDAWQEYQQDNDLIDKSNEV